MDEVQLILIKNNMADSYIALISRSGKTEATLEQSDNHCLI